MKTLPPTLIDVVSDLSVCGRIVLQYTKPADKDHAIAIADVALRIQQEIFLLSDHHADDTPCTLRWGWFSARLTLYRKMLGLIGTQTSSTGKISSPTPIGCCDRIKDIYADLIEIVDELENLIPEQKIENDRIKGSVEKPGNLPLSRTMF